MPRRSAGARPKPAAPPTIADALNVSNRSVSFRDAEVLLAHTIGCTRSWLHSHPETVLTAPQASTYATALARREANEPVAYITGVREFYGRPFRCDARALIPRPETEALIERSVAWISANSNLQAEAPVRVLELGTGCGNIAVTLALEIPALSLVATDIAAEAVELARENWELLTALAPRPHPHAPTFLVADLFDHPTIAAQAPYDLIVANLPYVTDTWRHNPNAQADVIFYEPEVALFGGTDGLDHYRRFFAEVPAYLKPKGTIIIECGDDHGTALAAIARTALPQHRTELTQDYAGLDRILSLTAVSAHS